MIPSAFVSPASTDCVNSQPTIGEFDITPANLYSCVAPASYHLPSIPGLIYQFLLRQDGSLSFLFLTPTFGEFFELESWDIELDTDTLISMIHPEDVAEFHDSIAHSAHNLESWRWSGRFLLPSGETKWIQWDAQPSLQANGNIFWNGLLVDVTTHHQLQAEVERLSFLLGLTERLQSSGELQEIAEFALHYLVQATQSAFGDIKVIRGVEENAQACPISDYISAEFLATYHKPSEPSLDVNLPDSIPKGQGLLWEVVETGQPRLVHDYANHPNALPEFRSLEIGEIGIFPIPAADGTVIGVLTLDSHNLQNIHKSSQADLLLAACRILGVRIERAKAQERLRQTNTELEFTSLELRKKAQQLEEALQELRHTQTQLIHNERMSSLGHLVAGIAHEINNPVNFIYGNIPHARQYFTDILSLLDLYEQHDSFNLPEIQDFRQEIDIEFLKEDLPKMLSSMQGGTQRIRNIVRSLRNFSRLDEAERKAIDLHESIDHVLMILDSRLQQSGSSPQIQVVKDYGNLPLVDCYAGQLNQVFMYILMNAIDALEENSARWKIGQQAKGGTPLIRISTELSFKNTVVIRILDNGPGIPEAIQAQLFDPFFTTKPVGKGTGLGLSISQQVITEKHGGQLRCVSIPGEGAEFIIEIPLQLARVA